MILKCFNIFYNHSFFEISYGNCKPETSSSGSASSISCHATRSFNSSTVVWKIRKKSGNSLNFSWKQHRAVTWVHFLFLSFCSYSWTLSAKCKVFWKSSRIFLMHEVVDPMNSFHSGHTNVHFNNSFPFRWRKMSSRHSIGKFFCKLMAHEINLQLFSSN